MIAVPPRTIEPIGLYLHFPFCAIRCSYCDFPTVAGRDDRIESYLDALCEELRRFQPELPRAVDSIFLGGGTPSRMTPAQVGRVLGVAARRFELAADCEITLECNPESLDPRRLSGYRDSGVGRLSIGMQSLDDRVLRQVGRAHDSRCAREAVRQAQRTDGFRISVDLIAGLPGERLADWQATLQQVIELDTDHVSVYLLETDKQSPLARAVRSGRTLVADDDTLAAAFRGTISTLGRAGFAQYEISNFARDGAACRHNLKYWSDVGYGGFGLGAHAYCAGRRRANRRDLDGYLEDVAAGRDPLADADAWDPGRRLDEALILGLRRVGGVEVERLGRRYQVDLRSRYQRAWERAADAGLVEWDGARVRLTRFGQLHSNALFSDLLEAA